MLAAPALVDAVMVALLAWLVMDPAVSAYPAEIFCHAPKELFSLKRTERYGVPGVLPTANIIP